MFGKKKKVSSVASKNELAELDASVNELSKQTSALLKNFGTPAEKPEDTDQKAAPPKAGAPQPAAVRKTGKSFDIIHDPKRRTSLKATLKTPEKAADIAEVELLPEHATKSYNELTVSATPTVVQDVTSQQKAPGVIGHQAGSLRIDSETSTTTEASDIDAAAAPTNEATQAQDTSETPLEPQAAKQGISFEEESESEPEVQQDTSEVAAEQTADESPRLEKTEEAQNDHETDEAPAESQSVAAKHESSSHDSGELYANNLVHDSIPKGYTPIAGQQKPTVFDTNEYHVELHDWSKLEHKASALWYILALLVTVAGALAYFVLSGQALPFIGSL